MPASQTQQQLKGFHIVALRPAEERGTPLLLCLARDYMKARIMQQPVFSLEAQKLLPLIRQMRYDDALIFRHWRLEYLYINTGFSHYRLYAYGHTLGVVDVRSPSRLEATRHYLAVYLAATGFQAEKTQVRASAARTAYSADTSRQYRLFKVNEIEAAQKQEEDKEENEWGDELWATI